VNSSVCSISLQEQLGAAAETALDVPDPVVVGLVVADEVDVVGLVVVVVVVDEVDVVGLVVVVVVVGEVVVVVGEVVVVVAGVNQLK